MRSRCSMASRWLLQTLRSLTTSVQILSPAWRMAVLHAVRRGRLRSARDSFAQKWSLSYLCRLRGACRRWEKMQMVLGVVCGRQGFAARRLKAWRFAALEK